MENYSNGYAEVYTILNYLNEDELNKIPKETLEVIAENRNMEYDYELNGELDLRKQSMLPETKAILFNLFRDYLSTPEQREKIIKMQREDRIKAEEKKKHNYLNANIFKERNIEKKEEQDNIKDIYFVQIKKESAFIRILNKIRLFFRR